MKPWHPERRQWRVIWIVYTITFLFSVVGMTASKIIGFVITAGALIIWRMQGQRKT